MYHFYILRCKDESLYCGITTDLAEREEKHNSGKGSVYVRSHGGGKIVYYEKLNSKSDALKREAEVKKWTRLKKLELIKNDTKNRNK